MKIVNKTRGTVLMKSGKVADNFLSRGVGLLNRKSLEPGEGLIITKNNSVHCFFMRFPIDVLFISKDHRVVRIYPAMPPWHLSNVLGIKGATYTVELEAGAAARSNTQEGDVLEWQPEATGRPVK
jgi:uncharacterized membrane protein (UPF0127 family)